MLKKLVLVVLALVALTLPLALRWFYFYDGRYEPGEVARPDLESIQAPLPETASFVDRYTPPDPGAVLVDMAHGNRVTMTDLSALQARLTARGQWIEAVRAAEDLDGQLRYAKALIIISPHNDWTQDDIGKVQKFVDKGGRLLLVTDPTRYDVRFDEWDNPILDEDVSHINNLAAQFGLLFQTDYLYNTTDNAGNFRNIKLADFSEHALTQGLDQIVFYAARSIVSEEPALISTSGETHSSSSERLEDLTVAVLAADGAVLALGDLTFMTEPSNKAYDNERLVANIADFLSGAQRQYDLGDFPFFFGHQVDLVFAGDPLFDSDLLEGGSALQALFADAGKELTIRKTENKASDTLFFGRYDGANEVEPYLANAQVTLLITPTVSIEEKDVEAKATPEPALQVTAPATPEMNTQSQITITAEISPPVESRVQIEPVGDMVLTGTLLLFLQSDGERQVMVVLADTEEGLANAIERLTNGQLEGCLLHRTDTVAEASLALCPTGEMETGNGGGGWRPPPPAPAPVTPTVEPTDTESGAGSSILIISLDDGESQYEGRTSSKEYAAILEGQYDVTTWSKANDPPLDPQELQNYDLLIWTAGDYVDAFGIQESELLLVVMMEGIPVIMSGAYISDAETASVQRDILVTDATHPATQGFKPGEVINLLASPSGAGYEIGLLEDVQSEDGVVLFVRGPDSEDSGAPSAFVFEDQAMNVRVASIGLPLYLLPEEARTRLVLDTVAWMLGAGAVSP